MVGLRVEPFESIDLNYNRCPDLTNLQQFLEATNQRIEMSIVGDPKLDVVSLRSGKHFVAFGNVERHWFFTQDMLACFCGRNGLRGMQMDRRRDVDRIDLAIAQHVVPIGVPLACAKLSCESFGQIRLRPADGHKLRPCRVAQCWGDALLSNVATTDKSPSNF